MRFYAEAFLHQDGVALVFCAGHSHRFLCWLFQAAGVVLGVLHRGVLLWVLGTGGVALGVWYRGVLLWVLGIIKTCPMAFLQCDISTGDRNIFYRHSD